MGQNEVLLVLRRQPFDPFRLVLTDGTTYEIRHPDMALVTRSTIHVGIPAAGATADAAGEVVIVSLLRVIRIEFLGSTASTGS